MAVKFDAEFIRRLEYLNILARKIFAGLLKAQRQSQKKGTSVEFSDYRSYTPGDDFRYIDWNIFARSDELLLKLFREEENLQLSVFVDCSASMNFGTENKFDYACMVAGALSYIGLANMDSLNLMPFRSAKMSPPFSVTEGLISSYIFRIKRIYFKSKFTYDLSLFTWIF